MAKQDRWQHILEMCKKNDRVYVNDLVLQLNSSTATIRRDLQQMEDLNMIARFHGGAYLSDKQLSELPMLYKKQENANEKKKIARLAAAQIKNNQTVYLDAGSSTYDMIPFIHAKNITVVTIGIPHISLLLKKDIKTIVPGGMIRSSTEAITGIQTLNQLDSFYFDCAFIGVNGIHQIAGLTTTNEQEAAVKQKAIQRSKTAYVLADSSKFNQFFPIKYADLNEVTFICSKDIDFKANLPKIITI